MLNQILTEKFWYLTADYLQVFLEQMQNKDMIAFINDEKASSIFNLLNASNTYQQKNDIAIIEISGPLTKKANPLLQLFFGFTTYQQIEADFRKAVKDNKIKGIMMRYDTPGGVVSGLSSLSDVIFANRGKKPILAYVENATSAGYWLASSADTVVLSEPTSKTGSIGCVAIHRSVKGAAEKLGLDFTVIASGRYKKLGNEYEQLSEPDKKYFQDRIEYYHSLFLEALARNLGKPVDQLPKDVVESKIFIGQEGITSGLASAIMSFDQALSKLKSMVGRGSYTYTSNSLPYSFAKRITI